MEPLYSYSISYLIRSLKALNSETRFARALRGARRVTALRAVERFKSKTL
jgi:hypothetical protein